MNANNVEKSNVETLPQCNFDDYYEAIRERICKLGYNDPKRDTDHRQRQVWEYIEKNQISIDIYKDYDFTGNLAPREDPLYENFQTRENCEDGRRVDYLYNEFYVRCAPQKRIIMGWWLGNFFPSLGNKRARAHLKGQKEQNRSESLGHVLVLGKNLSDEDKKWHGFNIAEISNHDDGDSPEPESTADIVSQLCVMRQLVESRDSNLIHQSEEEKIEWGKKWIKDTKPMYRGDEMSSVRGDIVLRAFGEDRKDSIPMPENSEISSAWVSFYRDEPFDEENKDADVTMMVVKGHDPQTIRIRITESWFKREKHSEARESMWLVIRCGKGRKNVTSLKSLKKARNACLDFLTTWNQNENLCDSGMPKIERVMFVKQLKGASDEAEMHVWNSVQKHFNKKEKINNG